MDPIRPDQLEPENDAILSQRIVTPNVGDTIKPTTSPVDDSYRPKGAPSNQPVSRVEVIPEVKEEAGSDRFSATLDTPPTLAPSINARPAVAVSENPAVPLAPVPRRPTPAPPSSIVHPTSLPVSSPPALAPLVMAQAGPVLEEHVPLHLPQEVHQAAPLASSFAHSVPPSTLPVPPTAHHVPPADTPPPVMQDARVGQVRTPGSGRTKKTLLRIGLSVIGLLIFGGMAFAGTYRFAPSIFFSVVPPSVSKYVNMIWPLHTSFDDMVPENTFMFGSMIINSNSPEVQKLGVLLDRIPGVSGHTVDIGRNIDGAINHITGVNFSTDVKPIIGDRLYVSVLNDQANASVIGVPLTNPLKALELLHELKAGSGQVRIEGPKAIGGVDVYSVLNQSLPSGVTPAVGVLRQAFTPQVAEAATGNGCPGVFPCAIPHISQGSNGVIYFAVLDRFLVISDSESIMQTFISQSHSRAKSLASTVAYQSMPHRIDHTLGELYVNTQVLAGDQTLAGLKPLYAGISGAAYTVVASDTGLEFHSSSHLDTARLDPEMKAILTAPDTPQSYLKNVPGEAALVNGGSQFQHTIALLAKLAPTNTTTVDDMTNQAFGKKLTDLSSGLSGNYSVSFQPDKDFGLVLQADVSDHELVQSFVDALKSYIDQQFGAFVTTHEVLINGETGTEFSIDGLESALDAMLRPVVVVGAKQLIVTTNYAGAASALTVPTKGLDQDARVGADQANVGANSNSFTYLNSRRLYTGVVGMIRSATGNPDQSQSNQEKVIDAMLDVFPSFSSATHGGTDAMSSSAIIPIVALTGDKKSAVETLIQSDASNIFNFATFLIPLGVGTTSASTSADAQRKSDVQTIVKAIVTYESLKSGFADFKTSGVEKLGPENEHMKLLLGGGDIRTVMLDPEWPTYYYSLESDGTSIKVSALVTSRPDGSATCEPSKQIRGRWTYCILQK